MASVALVRSATAVSNSGVTTLSVNLPASAAVGDYLVVTVNNANNNTTGFLNANLSTATVADNATSGTNTYTRQTSLFDNVVDTNGNFDSCGAVVFVAPVVRTNAGTFTVTVTTSVPIGDTFNDLRITVSEWSGVSSVEGFTTLNSTQLSIYDYTPYAPLTATVPGDMLITFQTIAGDGVTNRAGLGTSNVLAWTGITSVEYLAIANARQVIGTVYLLVAAAGNSFSAANIALLLKSTNATVASVPGHNVEFNVSEFPISAYDVWDGFPRIPSRTYDGLMFNRRAAAAATVPFTLRAKDFPNPTTRPVAAQQEVGFNNTIRQVAPAANPVPLLLRAKDFPNPSVKVYPQPDVVQNTTIRQVPPPPVRPVDAQNPSVRVYPQPDVVQNTTIRQVPLPPVRPVDAQNPSVRVYPQLDIVQNTLIGLVAPPNAPFKGADLPNPVTRAFAQQDVGVNYTISILGIPAPFKQADWPNPQFRAPRGISFDPAYLNPPPPVPITILVTGVTGFGTIGQVTVQITPSWVPINDSQTANWGVISGPQTPNWIPVVDTQTPGWAVISDPQTPNWAVDAPAPTITWTTITDAQTPNWGVVLSPQTSNWVQVDESQPSNWTLINDAQNPDWE